MAKILDYANDISFNRFTRIRRSISNSGYAVSQKGSPTFYSMEVNLKPLTKSQFDEVEAELIGLDDGVGTLTTAIPQSVNITNLQSTNAATPTVTSGTGNKVILSSVANLAIGDYLQFSTGTKVYQIKSFNPDKDNVLEVELNTSLINAVTGSTTIAVGRNVNFKLLLEATPQVTIIPGPGYNYYQYGSFNFREVL